MIVYGAVCWGTWENVGAETGEVELEVLEKP